MTKTNAIKTFVERNASELLIDERLASRVVNVVRDWTEVELLLAVSV
jgi:hypothetical protein